jgi:G3E family GTPase
VLIETTGLADPAPILHTLMAEPSIMRRYELAGVVTAVDAANGEQTLDTHPESVKQAAVADLLLLTKTDLTNNTTPPTLAAMLTRLNPGAEQITTGPADKIAERFNRLGLYDPATKAPNVERWLQDEEHHHGHGTHHHHDVNRHGTDIRAFSITRSEPLALVALENWLDILRATLGEQLLRVKGILNVEGYEQPVIIHGVQHVLHPIDVLDEWPTTDHRTRVVFITKGIEKSSIEGMLSAFQK